MTATSPGDPSTPILPGSRRQRDAVRAAARQCAGHGSLFLTLAGDGISIAAAFAIVLGIQIAFAAGLAAMAGKLPGPR